jgi:ketosteroid isomerase-like protein
MATKAAANVAAIIKANNKALGAALKAGDAAAISKMYAKGAKLLPPNAGVLKGKDIEAFWQTAVDGGITGVKLKSQEVEVHGGTAIEVGAYTMSAGGAVIDEGKYIVVWKKEGRDWKLSRDIFNTSRPAA